VLADFGIAKLLDSATQLTRTGGLLGTPLYIAPEQVAGQPVDPRADLYSLGVILYQLVTGRAPFQATTSSALLIQHLNAPPPAPRLLKPDLPAEVDEVLLRALAKEPGERFERASTLLETLLRALGDQAGTPAPTARRRMTPTLGHATHEAQANTLAEPSEPEGATPDDAPTEADPDLPAPTPGRAQLHSAPGTARAFDSAPGQLPPSLTAFVGRESELETLLELLTSGGARLVTVYGPGGVGKSRLAVEAARRLAEPAGRDGAGADAPGARVMFVPLAGVAEADHAAAAVAESAGLALAGSASPAEQLLDYLRPRQGLLVLDNFEHLLAGKASRATALLEAILAAAPGIRLLVTSRELVDLHGEHTLELRGLPLEPSRPADPAQTLPGGGESQAARLFALAAQRADRSFSVDRSNRAWIRRICELVAGLPLAIELAAVWVRQMTCAEIAAEIEHSLDFLRSTLRNVPERHRSLRAVFESAWQQLSAGEQTALRRLAIFPGGFGREAAEAVAGADLHTLADLTAASLVDGTPQGRYALHAVVRQYAREKLEAAGERAALEAAFARYYAAFAAERAAALKTSAQATALAELSQEIENLRSAWARAAAERRAEILDRMVEPLFRLYLLRCWYREGEAALSQGMAALEAPDGPQAALALARLQLRQGGLVQVLGKQEEAQAHLAQSLETLAPLNAPGESAMAHIYLGNLAYRQGHHLTAREHYRQAGELFEPLGDAWGLATAYNNLGNVAKRLDELDEARRLYEASLALTRRLGEPIGEAGCLTNLGEVAVLLGEHAEGQRLHTQALEIFRALGDAMGVGVAQHNLGQAAFYSGDFATADRHIAESLATRQVLEDAWSQAEAHYMLGAVAAEQGDWRRAAAEVEAAHRFYAGAGNPQRLAASLYAWAEAESALGRDAAAEAHLAEALAQLDSGAGEGDDGAAGLAQLALALDDFGDWARAWRLARFVLRQSELPAALRLSLVDLHDARVRRLPAAIRVKGLNAGLSELISRRDRPSNPG
jgi:predicted ATPase